MLFASYDALHQEKYIRCVRKVDMLVCQESGYVGGEMDEYVVGGGLIGVEE
jgi:hypothetical protein